MRKILFGFLLMILWISSCSDGDHSTENRDESGAHGLDLTLMDTTVSPADDFYSFVNGNWMKSAKIPEDRGRWGSFDELRIETGKNTLKAMEEVLLREDLDLDSDVGKAATFYTVAMDTIALNALGMYPIQEYLDMIKNISTLDDVFTYITEYFKINGNPYFNFYVRSGFSDSDVNSLFLGPGALGLPEREYYLGSDSNTILIQDEYKDLIFKVMSGFGIDEDNSMKLAEGVFVLEKQMAEMQLAKEERRNTNLLNNPRSLENVVEMMPFIDLYDFLQRQNITQIDTIIVTQPAFIRSLQSLFSDHSLNLHKAYLAWTVFHSYGSYLDKDTEKLLFSFYGKIMEGTDSMKPRWERVIETANQAIGEMIGQLYVEKYFPPDAKKEAEVLVDNVKKAFAERIRNLDWMTDATKEKALEKLNTFEVKIGYPDQWKDYSGLEFYPIEKGGSYAGHIRQVQAWNWQEDVAKIGKPVDKSEWFMAPQIVNAYYNPSYNEIVFPAAILQPPFFDFQADPAVNYGGIGAVIGHEISHGFDDQGSRFDADGNLKNWWTAKDRKAFEKRTKKLISQYDQYRPFDDLAVNGTFTLGENIGDLGGVNVAYDALQMHLQNEDPGLIDGFTQDQRFFINWATIWRTKYRDETLRKQIQTDPHAPGNYRAVGPIVNMDAFHEAFGTEPGDKLYVPVEERNRIW